MTTTIKFVFIALGIIVFAGCANQRKISVQGSIKLNGINEISLKGFDQNPIWGVVNDFYIQTDSSLNFKFETRISKLSKVWLQYGMGTANANSKPFLFMPGDKIQLNIEESGITIRGKGADKNKLYDEIEKEEPSVGQLYNSLANSKISMKDYVESIKEFRGQKNQLIDRLVAKYSLEKKVVQYFKDQTEIEYRNLIVSAFKHVLYNSDNSVNLFELFNNEISVGFFTNDQWVKYGDYTSLLRNYLFYVKGREISKKTKGVSMFKGINIALTDSLKGRSQQYALAEYICSDLDDGELDSLLIDKFNKIATERFAKKTLAIALEKYKQKNYLIGKPIHEEFSKTELADTANNQLLFGDILKGYEGNVVYVEVWSLGCGPCIKAMPTARQIEKELSNFPVKFVYLTIDKNHKNLWQHVFDVSKTKDNHYRLINGTNSRMNKFLNVSTVPWYLLFDKQGKMVDFHAEDPNNIKQRLIELAK